MEPRGHLARWLMDLQEFQFTSEHRPGRQNANADALSRLMVPNLAASHETTTASASKQDSDDKVVSTITTEPSVLKMFNLSLYCATLTDIMSVFRIFKVGSAHFCHRLKLCKI